ncbi:MAG: histidinol dehydrogenase [Gammaproteobacteria bacterium]|nr:histidinol dehydrogenase [Gammaproteobacteria bacterium]
MSAALIKLLDTRASDFEARLGALLAVQVGIDRQLERTVAEILAKVRESGDPALVDYTNRFDHRQVENAAALEIAPPALDAALKALPDDQRAALVAAAERVRDFHLRQKQESWDYHDAHGNRLGQRVTALDRVGIYVPGGKASYPSSVLMNAIPARVAGVGEILMTVPAPGGALNPMVLAAAALAGVDRVFTVGGAQAIAALAFGTATVPAVDKIVGPGNAYVAAAKRQVFGQVGLDMVAGPSEVLVICDGSADPDWIAMDLFSQAEHDEQAQAILLTPDADFRARVEASIARLLPTLERRDIIAAALAGRGALILVRDLDEAIALANRIAPEHLELAVADPERWLADVRHAGAIFVGCHTPEAIGDYCAGPSHVLPTSATARFSSPLGVYDFQKRTSIIQCSPAGAAVLAATASVLARGESLTAHARSAEYRRKPES